MQDRDSADRSDFDGSQTAAPARRRLTQNDHDNIQRYGLLVCLVAFVLWAIFGGLANVVAQSRPTTSTPVASSTSTASTRAANPPVVSTINRSNSYFLGLMRLGDVPSQSTYFNTSATRRTRFRTPRPRSPGEHPAFTSAWPTSTRRGPPSRSAATSL
jgi:hypothetical protein